MGDVVLVHGTTQTAAAYAERLAAGLPDDVDRPVVVAHSGSGVLLPALAEHLDAVHQVWLAAAVADHAGGRSFRDEIVADPTAVFRPDWIGVDPTRDPVLATHFLFHDADRAALREALSTLAPCDLSAVFDELPRADPAARPSTYVQPAGDRTLRSAWMARVARERLGVEPRVLEGGHNLYVAHPEAVADVIDGAARR